MQSPQLFNPDLPLTIKRAGCVESLALTISTDHHSPPLVSGNLVKPLAVHLVLAVSNISPSTEERSLIVRVGNLRDVPGTEGVYLHSLALVCLWLFVTALTVKRPFF